MSTILGSRTSRRCEVHMLGRNLLQLLLPRHAGRVTFSASRQGGAHDVNSVRVVLRRAAIETRLARLNWTKSELAARAGISRGHLSDLLAGRKRPRPELRGRLLNTFGATFDELFQIVPQTIEDNGNGVGTAALDGPQDGFAGGRHT